MVLRIAPSFMTDAFCSVAMDDRDIFITHDECQGRPRGGSSGLSVSLLGGLAQVDTEVFTQVGLHTRRAALQGLMLPLTLQRS